MNQTDPANAYWEAVTRNDTTTLEELLTSSPDLVNSRFVGVAWEPGEVIKADAHIDLDTFTNTAIHTAAVNSRTKMVELLLQFGADPNAIGYEENKGLTPPIVLAAWEGSPETLQALLEGGADPNVAASAETALYTAAEHGSSDKVAMLLSKGARHDVFTASIHGDVGLVKRFLGAYPPLRNTRSSKRNRTPQEEAEHHQQVEVLKLFQD